MIKIFIDSDDYEKLRKGEKLEIIVDSMQRPMLAASLIFEIRSHDDCIYSKRGWNFCGYNAIHCEKHGNIEAFAHPYYLAGNCPDYETYRWMKGEGE